MCGTTNIELVHSLGAAQVVDYLRQDFTSTGKTYDVIFDAVRQALFRVLQRLARAGRLLSGHGRVPQHPIGPLDQVGRRQEGQVCVAAALPEERRGVDQGAGGSG